MDNWDLVITVGTMLALMAIRVPIAFSLGAGGILGAFLMFDGNLYIVGSTIWRTVNSFTLAVIIFFVLMGELLYEAKLSQQLYSGAHRWLARFPGGVLHTNVITSTIYAACTGLSMATAATLGKMAYTEGKRLGYSTGLSMGSLAAGATLGILIPPSVIMIIYGVLTEQSIGRLYMAGVIPGVMVSLMFMAYIALYAWKNPAQVPRDLTPYTARQKLAGLVLVSPMLVIIVVVLGTIYLGFATPNEAGALGAFMALLLGVGYRRFTLKGIRDALVRTARVTGMSVFLLMGATLVSTVMAHAGVNQALGQWLEYSGVTWFWVYLVIIVVYLLLGFLLDSFSILMLTVPVLVPVIQHFNVDPIFFGIIVTVLIEIGLITPPFGINLFVLDGVTGGGNVETIAKGSAPFVAIMLIAVGILTIFPSIALWLPAQMYTR